MGRKITLMKLLPHIAGVNALIDKTVLRLYYRTIEATMKYMVYTPREFTKNSTDDRNETNITLILKWDQDKTIDILQTKFLS